MSTKKKVTSKKLDVPAGIILAAGSSTRTRPLTDEMPKPLLPVAGKPIIDHILEAMLPSVGETVIVVGFKSDMIKEHLKTHRRFGTMVRSKRIRFVEQNQQLGTAHALDVATKKMDKSILMAYGDNIIFGKDVKAVAAKKNAILAFSSETPEQFGVIEEQRGVLQGMEEKPTSPRTNLINAGVYRFEKGFLSYLRKAESSVRGELEIPQLIELYRQKGSIHVVKASGFFPIGHPWDVLTANEELLKGLKTPKRQGIIERGAVLKGNVSVGKGTVIRSGTYIVGPVIIGNDCTIGPNCFVRGNTSIGDGCKVGNAVEVKNSVLMQDVSVGHLSYVGDSVIGPGSNLGAGTITANLKHNNANVRSMVKGKMIDTGRRKLGAIIGPDVHTGINTSIYPGRKIHAHGWTKPGDIVKEDIR
ncbi:MAG: bifunctional sugar-1-phosphate nucleotidylyltransferase/acetyltransferase [archaeon]